jgi:hypothetical protein
MAILVVCPGCRKRFQVSDQFAGKTGPCPSCKTTIKIPTKSEEVVVHAPELHAGGGKSTTGEIVLKPVSRKDTKFEPTKAAIIVGAVVVVFAAAFFGRGVIPGTEMLNRLLQGLGLVLVSPALTLAGYTFLRNDELEPYRGKQLALRAGAVAVIYAVLWAAFALSPLREMVTGGELWMWLVVAPPFVVVGGLTALACLDLDFGSGVFHYAFYLVVTIFLGWAAGLGWPWQAIATQVAG